MPEIIQKKIPRLSLEEYHKKQAIFDKNLSVEFMKQSRFYPFELKDNILRIVMADPDDFYTIDAIRLSFGFELDIFRGEEEEILEAIETGYGAGAQSVEKIIEEMDKTNGGDLAAMEEDVSHLKDLASEAPIIKLVNKIITRAVEMMASDIHFEPFEKDFKIRYRIDGVLLDAEFPPKRLQAAIISRVKIIAKMNIAERRLPQDGRVKLKIAGKEIDFRVSTVPTLFGESLVMRILDRESLVLDFVELGFPEAVLTSYNKLIEQPYGIILVTGPTGSGKTTTLYASLSKLNSAEKKIITVEDPVEYQLKGIN
nr:Flp pilus assembly complex ATPase component TadA [Desulfobacterales bacterium]